MYMHVHRYKEVQNTFHLSELTDQNSQLVIKTEYAFLEHCMVLQILQNTSF